MPRPRGSVTDSSKGRSPGPGEKAGHRYSRDALARQEDFRPGSLALRAQEQALVQYELQGSYEMALLNAARLQAVVETHWNALLAEEVKGEEASFKTILDLSRRLAGYAERATKAWLLVGDIKAAQQNDLIVDAVRVAKKKTEERSRDDKETS